MTEPSYKEPLPDETAKAFYAFTIYRDLEPHERSIDLAYWIYKGKKEAKKGQRATAYFFDWSVNFRWVDRVSRYDIDVSEQRRQKLEALRERSKVDRVAALVGYQQLITSAMARLEADNITFADVTRALGMIAKELRAEFDDMPTQKVESSGSGFLDDYMRQKLEEIWGDED